VAYEYGIHAPTRWFDELLAHYIAYVYEKAKRARTANIVEAFTTLSAPPRKHTSLEDFETLYSKMDYPNFSWYHRQFQTLVAEIYSQGADFLIRVKAEFGAGEQLPPELRSKATTGEMNTTELVSKLERINPAFGAWATTFSR
jgi:hypothetical protein